MNRFRKPFNLLLTAWLLTSATAIYAETAEEKGLAIAKESKARDIGWSDMQADMKMILRNKQGQESLREIRLKSLELESDGDKSLSIFDKPRDVKGTAFLSFSHPVGADDQWLYLPALKRVKRISSRNKSGPFMGSEFAYEDLTSFEVEKYSYKYIGDETVNGEESFKI
ncbi:MAG: outer membrane lipoprotein-sorting protein, partial [Candidatus Sedimenticola sp. (ex Thyasira tokunagai)]